MIFLLRFMLKLLFAPVSLVLALFVWFFTWLVCVSSVVLGLA
ncbi:succinate dehydrogenase, partial [Faecalibacterium sp. An58]